MKQKLFISIVDCLMGLMNCGDKILRVEKKITSGTNIFRPDGIHVMDQDAAVNLSASDTKVAAIVTGNDQVPNASPFR